MPLPASPCASHALCQALIHLPQAFSHPFEVQQLNSDLGLVSLLPRLILHTHFNNTVELLQDYAHIHMAPPADAFPFQNLACSSLSFSG